MLALLIVSTVLCFGYITVTRILRPKLTCISETWYHFRWWFTAWCWTTAFTLLPVMLDKTVTCQYISFMSCAALLMLGAFPRYLNDQTFEHYFCAITAGVMAVAWTAFFTTWWVALIVLAVVTASYFASLWLAEVVGLLIVYSLLYIF